MSSAASCRSGHLLCEFGPDAKMKQERVKRGSTMQKKLHVSTSALCITSTTSLKKNRKNTHRISKAKDAYGSGVHFSHSSRSTFVSEFRAGMVDVSLWRQDHLSWLWQLTEHPVINVPSSALPVLRCVHPSFRILSPWGPVCGGRQLHGTQPNDSSLPRGWKTWWRVQQKVALAMCCVLRGPGTDFLPRTGSFVSHVPRCYLFKKYFSTFQPRLDRRAHTHRGSLRWVDQLPRRKREPLIFFP